MAKTKSISSSELEYWKQGMFRLVDHEIDRHPVLLRRHEIAGVRWLVEEFKKLELRAIKKHPKDGRHIKAAAAEFYSSNLLESGGVKKKKRSVGRASRFSIDVSEMILWVFARSRNDSEGLNEIHALLKRGGTLPNYWLKNSRQPLSDYDLPIFPETLEADPNWTQKLKDQLWMTIYRSKGFAPNRISKSSAEKAVKRKFIDILASTPIPPPGAIDTKQSAAQEAKVAKIEELFREHRKMN